MLNVKLEERSIIYLVFRKTILHTNDESFLFVRCTITLKERQWLLHKMTT